MSKPYGPYNSGTTPALAAGTVIGVPVDQAAAAIRISNQTLTYDLLVSFAPSQPPAVTSVGGTGPWAAVLHPGDRPCFTLQNADKTPTVMGQFWQGTVWLLPLNTSGQLAQAGTVPSLANVWLTTYAAGEPIPPADPAPLAVASTQQQRVVGVPIVPDISINGSIANLTVGSTQYVTAGTGSTDPFGPNSNAIYTAYLYAADLMPSGGTYDSTLQLIVDVHQGTAGGAVTSSAVLFTTNIYANATANTRAAGGWRSPYPLFTQLGGTQNTGTTYWVRFGFKCPGGSATIAGFAYDLTISFALTNGNAGAYFPPMPISGPSGNTQASPTVITGLPPY